ncbi:MAG TPA: hypothetical protein VH500_16665 [Nitrososphaeraceae archaeon]
MVNTNNNEEEITRVKHLAYCSNDPVVQTDAIDALATHEEQQAIDAITEIINLTGISDQVKEHGQSTIKYLKSRKKDIHSNSI